MGAGATLIGPSEAKLGHLRVLKVNHGSDPAVLECSHCKEHYGCRTMLRRAISAALVDAGLPPLPTETHLLKQQVDEYRWTLQADPSRYPIGEEKHTAIMALLQSQVNLHSACHTNTCAKKCNGVCRFKIPYLHAAIEGVFIEQDEEKKHTLELQFKRSVANIYTAPFNRYVSALFLSNTNMQFVKNQLIAFYISVYMTKTCQASNDAILSAERSLKSYLERRHTREQTGLSTTVTPSPAPSLTIDVLSIQSSDTSFSSTTSNMSSSSSIMRAPVYIGSTSATSASSVCVPVAAGSSPLLSTSCSSTFEEDASKTVNAPISSSSSSSPGNLRQQGIGILQSAAYNFTKYDAIAAPLAAYLLLGGSLFHYSHDFSPLPFRQGVEFLENKPVQTLVDNDHRPSTAVLDYLCRSSILETTSWYRFCQRYEVRRKSKKKKTGKTKDQKDGSEHEDSQELDGEDMQDEDNEEKEEELTESDRDVILPLINKHPLRATHQLAKRLMEAVPRLSGKRLASIERLSDDSYLSDDASSARSVQDFRDQREYYGSAIMVMFVPWRKLSDLKRDQESWWDAYKNARQSDKLKDAETVLKSIEVGRFSALERFC